MAVGFSSVSHAVLQLSPESPVVWNCSSLCRWELCSNDMCILVTTSLKSCSSRYLWYQDDKGCHDWLSCCDKEADESSCSWIYAFWTRQYTFLKPVVLHTRAGTRVGGIWTSRAWEPHGMWFSLFKCGLDLILHEAVPDRPVLKNWIHIWKVIHLLRVIFSFVLSKAF